MAGSYGTLLTMLTRLQFLYRLLSRPSGSSSMVDIFPRKTSSWVSSAQFFSYGLPTSSDELNYSFFYFGERDWEGIRLRDKISEIIYYLSRFLLLSERA